MIRFAKTPPKTPPRRTRYVPLEPMKPKTQAEIAEEELAISAADGLYAMGRGGLRDSQWASPQYYQRVQAAPVNVALSQPANTFFQNAARAGIKIGPPQPLPVETKVEAKFEAPVKIVSALATPPATPPPTAVAAEVTVATVALAPSAVSSDNEDKDKNKDKTKAQDQNKVARTSTAVNLKAIPSVTPQSHQQPLEPSPAASISPQAQQLQPGFNSVQSQGQSAVSQPVVPQPQQVRPSDYLPPHLAHLKPGFKPAQPQAQSAAASLGQTAAAVSPSEWKVPYGSILPQQVQGSIFHQGRKSTSLSPAPQTHIARFTQDQNTPPHLRRPVHVEISAVQKLESVQTQNQSIVPSQLASPAVSKPVEPQNQSVVLSQVQDVPPHLRGGLQVSPPQMAIHQRPPHLQGISFSQTSQSPFTQVHNNTTSSRIVGKNMAPALYPSRSANDGQDDFLQWLSHKQPTKNVEVAKQVTTKSEGPFKPVPSPQALPVQYPQVSPSKQSINSKWSQESVKNINDTDEFLRFMEKPKPKVQGVVPTISTSSKQPAPIKGWQRPKTAFDNPRWKLNDDSVVNFETYIKNGDTTSSATPAAQGNSVHGTSNVRAAKIQATQIEGPKVQQPNQKPTFNGAQKLGQSASQVMQIFQNGPSLPLENKKPAAQAPVSNVAPAPAAVAHAEASPCKPSEWQGMPNMKAVAAMISSDIIKVQPETPSNTPPLTTEALFLTTGFQTVNQNNFSDDRISSTGLGKLSSDHAHDPRHTQGNDMTNQFFEWDGSRAPAPIWEEERPSFDDSFIPEYIKEWQKTLPSGQFKVDINDDKFMSGAYPINNVFFVHPIDQGPDTIPDVAKNTNDQEMKRQFQTAEIEANNYSVAVEKKRRQMKRQAKATNLRYLEIAAKEEEPNPFSPMIDIYLRPAEEKDATDIAAIYNWYISNSNIPEDQEPITDDDGKWLIKQAKNDKLPFLVAIKGRQPSDVDAQGRSSQKIMLPVCEQVIGFCFPERFNYGFSGKVARSRATVTLQLYVHNEYTRKGVGRNLLDRLIHCLNPGYAYKNATSWINPSNDKLYETEGAGLFHQLLFQIPVEHKDDPNIAWLTKFLLKFLFKENAIRKGDKEHPKRLTSVCRSTTRGRMAHFLDLAIFHYEARLEGEFDPYN